MILLSIPAKKASVSVKDGEVMIGLDIKADSMIRVIELAQRSESVNTVTLKDITLKVIE